MVGKIGVIRYEAHNGLTVTFGAELAVGTAVKVTGVKTVGAAAAADHVVGTVVASAKAGEKGTIRLRGDVVPMTAAGAVTAGDAIAASAGSAKKDAGTDKVFGVALTTAADGAEVLVVVL
jgi:hypothetical protein